MPFVESSQSVRSRLHLTGVSLPVIVGIVALFAASCVLMVQNMSYVLSGERDLVVTRGGDDAAVWQDEGAAGIEHEQRADGNSDGASGSDVDAQAGNDSGDVGATVFVSGCVVNPGVYTLPPTARVGDALDAAGGFTEDAATDAVNLARLLVDGEQIAVPSEAEVEAGLAGGASHDDSSSANGGSAAVTGLVNINTADTSQLVSLPGVGEATAAKIIASREQEGPFQAPEDLMRVSGIGQKKYDALADLITVG